MLMAGATWTDRHGVTKPMAKKDVLIITPYNAQVIEIQRRLPGVEVARSINFGQGSTRRHLFAGDFKPGRRAQGHGLFVQRQPSQCRYVARTMFVDRGCQPCLVRR